MMVAKIDSRVRNFESNETTILEQHIKVDGDDLVYTTPGGAHEVRVNADDYIKTLLELTGGVH